MSAVRYSLYRDIHKGIRALLADLVSQAGRTDYADAVQVQALKSAVFHGFVLLESHGHHEELFVGPLVREVSPAVARALGAAHQDQDNCFPALRALLLRAAGEGPAAPHIGHAFTVALSRFAGEMLVHMADEEEAAMPALQEAYTDAELMAVEQALVATVPPAKMARYLSFMLPAMNRADRADLLCGAQAHAPAVVFAAMLSVARDVLAPAERKALEEDLGLRGSCAA